MSKSIAVVLLFVLVVVPISTLGQTPSTQQGEEKIVAGTTEVVFDAVVKDKKGRPVKDLKSEDFQITEDGVAQEVRSFRLVAGDTPESAAKDNPARTAAGGPKATARVLEAFNAGRIGTVALVFDRLSVDSRTRARDAAIAYLGNGLGQSDFVGVFGIDLKLSVFQTFTNDEKLIRPAIDRAGSSASSPGVADQSQITEMSVRNTALTEQLSQAEGNAAASQNMGNIGSLALDKALNGVSLRAAEGFERMEQTEKGQATTDGLLSIVSAMGSLPGRKAIIFFSEGVSIPTAVAANFRTVISNANRANVSIYAVDAMGLRTKSADVESGKAMTALGQQRASQAASGSSTALQVLASAAGQDGNVFATGDAPHDWLFPRSSCVVLHGGAGTTAAVLRAGVPGIFVPHGYDQRYWAQICFELGCTGEPIEISELTENRLAGSIELVLRHSGIRDSASQIGVKVRSERGVQCARHMIEDLVRKVGLTEIGDF